LELDGVSGWIKDLSRVFTTFMDGQARNRDRPWHLIFLSAETSNPSFYYFLQHQQICARRQAFVAGSAEALFLL
jgi:hypothetical protein